MLAAFATDPGPPSELIRLSEHRSHVSRHRAILARPEPEFLRNALVAIRSVAAMIPEELRHALRHCRGAHGWSSRRLSAASSIPPNNHTLSHVAKYRSLMPALALIFHLIDGVDAGTRGPVSRAAVAQAAAWCEYLAAHARRLYGAVTDAARVAAALLATRLSHGRLASPFTAREVYRQEWTGLTEPRVVQGALECLEELGWIRPEALRAPDGGRPTVRFHLNPRLRADGPPRSRRVRSRGAPKPLQ